MPAGTAGEVENFRLLRRLAQAASEQPRNKPRFARVVLVLVEQVVMFGVFAKGVRQGGSARVARYQSGLLIIWMNLVAT